MSQLHLVRRAVILGAGATVVLGAGTKPAAGQSFSEGYTFLNAVRQRDAATVERLVSAAGSTAINTRDRANGEAALHIVVRGRDLGWTTWLLGRGARPDMQSNAGETPLILCVHNGWVDGARLLLEARASVDLPDRQGMTPLILAVTRRDLPMVRLLRSWGADPNRTDRTAGYSAIDYARQDARAGAILNELLTPPPPR